MMARPSFIKARPLSKPVEPMRGIVGCPSRRLNEALVVGYTWAALASSHYCCLCQTVSGFASTLMVVEG